MTDEALERGFRTQTDLVAYLAAPQTRILAAPVNRAQLRKRRPRGNDLQTNPMGWRPRRAQTFEGLVLLGLRLEGVGAVLGALLAFGRLWRISLNIRGSAIVVDFFAR